MKSLALSGLIISMLVVQTVAAQSNKMQPNRVLPSYISMDEGGKQITANAIFTELATQYKLHPKNTFVLLNSLQDELGLSHKRYIQHFDSKPVEGSMIMVHEKLGAVTSVNGDAFRIQETKATAIIPEEAALAIALDYFKADTYIWEQKAEAVKPGYESYMTPPEGKLVYAAVNGKVTGEFRLAYKFDVYAIKPLRKEYVYVDALTGKVIWTLNTIEENSVNGSALTLFSGTQSIIIDSLGPTNFRLLDGTRGNGIHTWNLNNGTSSSSAVEFTNSSNYWSNNVNQNRAAYDAHWGSEKVYDYFLNTHNRNSFNNAGAAVNSYIHYSTGMANAFWDGIALYYGDGDVSTGYNPFTCIDVVGHEFTHAVTTNTANLVYMDEPGALNESFSDIFGQVIEFIAKPSTATWKLAEEATTNGQGIRNMSNPNLKNHPDTYFGLNWYSGPLDNGGVHTNSGVQNFWFYVLAQGDTGVNDLNHAFAVPGIGIANAAQIAYRSLNVYLTPSSQYADARFYSIQAAKDLYGACSPEVRQTTNAWYAVGVGDSFHTAPPITFTATPQFSCSLPAPVQFNNTTSNTTSVVWHFGDGTTSNAANPSHVYSTTGQFNVKLVVTRCNNTVDSITLTNYITVDTSASYCDTTVLTTATTQTVVACTGVIVDNGGVNGYYSDNVNSGVMISSPGAAYYRFRFLTFSTESCCDDVVVYNGPTTSSPIIGYYAGSGLPNGGNWIYTNSNQFLFRFMTDGSVTYPGFVVQYECLTAAPTADFHSPDSNSCSGNVAFVNNTFPTSSTYSWDFGDGGTSTQAAPTHTYLQPGNYTVRLIACNSFGCDTLIRTSYIDFDTTLPLCQTTPVPPTGTTFIQKCTGSVTDNGGPSNYYTNNVFGGVSVSTTVGANYRVRFTSFKTESCCDYVTLYNGPSSTSPVIGTYSGYSLPNGGNWIYTTSNQFFVRFSTDGSVVDSGFILEYQCITTPPVADFYSADSTTCSGNVAFVNSTAPIGTSYNWDFGDGGTSTAIAPSHNYLLPGSYTVRLIACNSFGCDTLIRTNYIDFDTTLYYCQYTPIPPTGTTSVVKCNGVIVDNGNVNNNYSNNVNGGVFVSFPNSAYYRFRFTSFNTQSFSDVVGVHNGSNSGSPLIGSYSGATLPNGGNWIYTSSNQFYVSFYSNSTVTAPGFVLEYECLAVPPVANFHSPDSVSCNGFAAFVNTTAPATGATYSWDFGDGGTSTVAVPTHTYLQSGNYTVRLIACNSFGCDTLIRTAYIHYDTTLPFCQITPVPPTGTTFIQKCTGVVTDNGGIAGYYTNGVNGGVSVSTTSGSGYRVRFTSFETESCCDYVYLYDGPTTSSPLIGMYLGYSLPNGGNWIYTSGNQFLVRFTTDGSVVDSGFILEYQCLTIPPVAAFYSPDSASCDGQVGFVNTTAPSSGTTYSWDFGDGGTSTAATPAHTYLTPGFYTVRLIACNSYGCDTLIRTGYINYDTTLQNCQVTTMPTSGTTYIQKCNGTIVDDGGPNGFYQNSAYGIVSVSTTSGANYRYRFTTFNTEGGYDYVTVYDGPNTSSPVMGSYSGSWLPNGGNWVYTNTNSFAVQFTTDGSVTYPGFILEYQCLAPASANFYCPDSVSCTNQVSFVNTTTPAATTYHWDFGDGSFSNTPNPSHAYLVPGNYNVSLIACFSQFCDTLVKPVQIATISASANIPDTAIKGVNFLVAGNNGGSNSFAWYVDGLQAGNNMAEILNITVPGLHVVKYVVSNTVCSDTITKLVFVTHPAGVGSLSALNGLTVYPNPATDILIVEGSINITGGITYSLTNALGQQVSLPKELPVTNGKVHFKIDISDIASGVYHLNLVSAEGTVSRKIFVSKR